MKIKGSALFLLSLSVVINAQNVSEEIYNKGSYSWKSDRVEQGAYSGKALSPTHIVSNYASTVAEKDTLSYKWEKSRDISYYPQYKTPFLLENAVYNMGLDEMVKAVEPNLTLRTGEWWGGVWTRDMSYSIILSMAQIQPTVAKNCLLLKINSLGKIIQDTGTGGSWPISTDREVWVSAAWEVYKATGDMDWIRTIIL